MKYRPPVLDRRITLRLIRYAANGLPLAPVDTPVWANRRDSALALEEIGDTASIISGTTVWTIRELDGQWDVNEVVGDDEAIYQLRGTKIERGGENAGMRARYIELPTNRRSNV